MKFPIVCFFGKFMVSTAHYLKVFGRNICIRRHNLGLTQEKLAERCKLHPTYIGAIERGERNLSFRNILAIARGLKCSSKDLMPD